MKITIQNNNNDCGVCVLNSIYQHLYKKEITASEILKNFEISKNGMSIYDLEILAKDINIEMETYKANFDELMSTHYRDYFITLVSGELGNHFVICKMKSKYVEIYDSVKGFYKLDFNEFRKMFNDIFIIFYKSVIKKEINEKDNWLKNIKFFDLPNEMIFCSLLVLFDLFTLVMSLLGSSLVKLSINFISDNIPENLFFIGLYFIFIFLIEALMQYLLSLIKVKKIDQLSKRNMIFYLNYLSNKNMIFFENSNRKELYQYPTAIAKILSTKYLEKPQLVSDLVFGTILFVILGYISFYYMIFAIVYSLISIALSYCLKKFNEKNYENNNLLKNETDYYFQQLYDFLYKEKSSHKLKYLNEKCKSLYWSLNKQNIYFSSFLFNNNFLKFFLKKIIFVLLVTISVFWITNNSIQNIDVAKLIFTITTLGLFDNSINSIFGFFSDYANYKKSSNLLKKFLENDNKNFYENNKIALEKVTSIEITKLNFKYDENYIFQDFKMSIMNNTFIYGKNGIGKSTLLKILALSLNVEENSEILFNDLNLNDLNLVNLEKKICYIPSDATPVEIDYSQILSLNPNLRKEIASFLKETKISSKSTTEFSKGEIQISNLIHLLKLKNHLILLDECFSNISDTNIKLFMDYFYQKIVDSNFVICVSHSEKIKKYFDYHKEIK